jgi:hypothetical protein
MKVLAFTPQYLPHLGGIEILVDSLAQSLRASATSVFNALCVPKTSSGDDFGFDRKNSLFLNQTSLFGRNNSLLSAPTIMNGYVWLRGPLGAVS